MDAAIPADAQNAPTGIWKSRTEREIPTAPTPIIVVVNERKNNGDSNSVAKLSTESDQAHVERCGLRVESRAKTKTELSMSHSPTDQERAWHFGMVDADVIAFPVCKAGEEKQWSTGRLKEPISYWHERNWIRWQPEGRVNYVRVARFRAVPQGSTTTKGVTEGSETSVVWKARFSRRDGVVEAVEGQKITIARSCDGHRHTQTVPKPLRIAMAQGEEVALNQIIASEVRPESDHDLRCPGVLPEGHLPQLLGRCCMNTRWRVGRRGPHFSGPSAGATLRG